jgi:signal transduction histidine kinase/CheY-like chemotaxis protein
MLNQSQVLILSAGTPDAEEMCDSLSGFGIRCSVFSDISKLIAEIGEMAGVVIIAKDALSGEALSDLSKRLSAQPKWSFLPVIMILSRKDLESPEALEVLTPLPNLTVLEKPVLPRALLSIVRAALAERRRQYELRDSLNEAIEANRAKSEFLANMSHEIRTPLGIILGFSELMADPSLNEAERRTYFEVVQRNGQLLSAIINDVLDLAKVEAGRMKIEPIEVSVGELISEVVSALKVKIMGRSIRISVEKDQSVPDLVKTDPIRLKQILMNIVGNAIKFTNHGSVKISVSEERVNERSGKEQRFLVFKIRDTGIGLKPEQASVLFQAFAQADGSITRKFGGSGLGLVLSQKLARALGGDIKLVQSTFGEGSTFEIKITLDEVQSKISLTAENKNLPPMQFDFTGKRILLVDDSKDNQLLVRSFLSKTGAQVLTAEHGEEGYQRALETNPDVVMMDVQMPVLSGIEATKKLRAQGFNKPIIALTAHAFKGDRERCLAAGYSDYIAKPINRAELYRKLEELFIITSANEKGV